MSKARRNARRNTRREKLNKGRGMAGMDGMSDKDMQSALSQMDTEEVPGVTEVIVRTATEEIVLENPEVTIMNVGQELWSVVPSNVTRRPLGDASSTAEVEEEFDLDSIEVSATDVNLVVSTANVSEEAAILALKKNKGDIAAAIMSLK